MIRAMPKRAKELTAVAVAKLKAPGRYAVGGAEGLHLRVTETGSRLWVLRIIVGEKRRDLGLGNVEHISLSQARDLAREARKAVALGQDPSPGKLKPVLHKKVRTFEHAANELIASKKAEWKNDKHQAQWHATLKSYAYTTLGELDVANIGLDEVLAVLKPIWETKTETATRVRGRIEAVLDYATVHKWREGDNPARWKGLLDKVLPAPAKVTKPVHHAAMPIDDTPAFMRLLAGVPGASSWALRLLLLTVGRSGEIRGAQWSEFDFAKALWLIPAERMKADKHHIVPLSRQALELLEIIPRMAGSNLLFPSTKGEGKVPISDMSMLQLLRKRSLPYVPHGFRSTFRDWAGDRTEYPRELIEAALAHTVQNAVEAAYRRLTAVERRRPLMQDWADFLTRKA
jgi:integrase